ncbi:formimidoylglutamase [Mucilaginibacter sp. AW1-3]
MEERNSYLNHYRPPQAWTGRDDGPETDVQRWHQRVQCIDLFRQESPVTQNGVLILGFACDEGVRRNGGRTGAKEGPAAIRRACASLPVHFSEEIVMLDGGDIVCNNGDLEAAQAALSALVLTGLRAGYRPLIFGGGHEVAYGHYTGIKQFGPDKRIGIINFDAHFDLREPGETGPSSGTGFWQIASENHPFHYLPVGIQTYSNTQRLFSLAESLGVAPIMADQFSAASEARVQEFIAGVDQVYLSIDLDVFAAAYAPGVSAPTATGLLPDPLFFKLYRSILQSGKVISMDIAELNPSLDRDGQTARLAAALAFAGLIK